jgi:hypothetical protein
MCVTRTAIILFAIVLFVSWYVHVVNRASNGIGFHAERLWRDVAFTATVSGALYVLIVTWALLGVYFRHVRGLPVGFFEVLVPPFLGWSLSCLAGGVVGVVLAESYCIADEQMFRLQARRHLASASRNGKTSEQPIYSRGRWWPAGDVLVSRDL